MADKTEHPLVVTYTGDMPQNRKMVFQTHIDVDAEMPALHALCDKMRIAFERQFAFGELEIHKLELEQQMKQAKDHAERIAVVEQNVYRDWQTNGRRGEAKLSHSQQKEKEQAYANAEAIKERIARVKKFIDACEQKIAG